MTCHPEGTEDGHTWVFNGQLRRTQNLRGGILATAPFHWTGDLVDFDALVHEVFDQRMGGRSLGDTEADAMARWIDSQPSLRPPAFADRAAVRRGAAVFSRADVGCAVCHPPPTYTAPGNYNVGTLGTFQIPSLIGLVHRAPYMHDGCAKTLHDRFYSCGGADMHGHTSHLREGQIDDLVAFLESL